MADIEQLAAIDPKKLSKDEFVTLLSSFTEAAQDGVQLDLSTMPPQDFARIISRASKEQIEAVMAVPALRGPILDEVFHRMEVHFRTERAGSTRAVVHFRLTNGDDFDRYQVHIDDGACKITKDGQDEPRATVTLPPLEFLKLATGNASAPVLFMTGKLKVKGDLGFAAGFMSLFDIPKA
ncbi:SCP2 sterol-binding domain-containing protein [Kutzneria sp. 744]|uniref:SCP2 sterol-binding domain-containing protein n=1 Tax=Kutzneria sp. (strain 744) TaxID=345341 RepID=UPI0003EEB2E1|nr:SCP2 sterol-binding domain-containing protein [Kutzneria sp. 744]EWM14991.1 SCP-2 sterol transfer family protein [Kutzneria sp. 744]